MLAVAARELAALDASMRDRVSLAQATADRLPFDDGAFDIVVTAFVLQLVPSRFRALREARRVLGWHGALAHATWLAGGSFPADDAYADALVAAGLEPRQDGGAHDEPGSPAAAAAQLRRAGFSGVTARPGEVDHRFTPDGFLAFLACSMTRSCSPPWSPRLARRWRPTSWNACAHSRPRACGCGCRSRS